MSGLPQKIYPVVDTARWVDRLGGAGARFIQLRVKELEGAALREEIRQAHIFARTHGVCLVLNDYWQIALEEGIDYIHLGQEDLDTADLAAVRKAGIRFGLSTHSHEELDRALSFKPDYVALGPIWPTRLKKMAFGPQGVAKLTEWKKLIGDLPLVAIGGVAFEGLKPCLDAGADSVAAVSAFTQHADPEGQIKRWLTEAGA
ncbi:thiamine-phosphate pyrophosphorylase [Acetobacter sp. DmW_043]|uniref:thiamine phosphate synthase n=1 Tax=Acetobacter sp. DmW_043 TaxID=1670658 RepID=UPI000A399FC1|nr:thiamine phosphate synthase [Acetobacter sp. DmW_043]OUI88822.1 thiamine-phosphate pyrophosphorylase [Acetobacter sp. DmW_043]